MPILEKLPADSPLSQGDLLKGIKLFASSAQWGDDAAKPESVDCAACLVVSRPCVIPHKRFILVSMVDGYKDNPAPADGEGAKEILEFLRTIRDGDTTPDKLYLGQIPDLGDGRFRANLDSLHTIKVPNDVQLTAFLQRGRIGRLAQDFVRDLHIRAFRAFASLGFDDHRWMTDEDLNWLVQTARKEFAELEAQLAGALAGGDVGGNKKIKDNATKQLAKIRPLYQPYIEELESRKK